MRQTEFDRVGRGRNEGGARRDAGFAEALGAVRRVQPRIVADLLARGEVRLDPRGWRCVDEVLDREQLGVGLLTRLQRIAAIDEQHRALRRDDGSACRAGETGKPGEPLFGRRQIFVLVTVGVGNDEGVEAAARQFLAERGNARRRLRCFRRIVEILEGGAETGCFVHNTHPWPLPSAFTLAAGAAGRRQACARAPIQQCQHRSRATPCRASRYAGTPCPWRRRSLGGRRSGSAWTAP